MKKESQLPNQLLKLISASKRVVIKALNGKSYISENKNLFRLYIDPNFKNWELNKLGLTTVETLLNIYEIVKDATFIQIFNSLSSDLDQLVMTQNQIVNFCKKHPTWLRQEEYATFFLIKENNKYLVVCVYVYFNGLRVCVYHLNNISVWHAGCYHRLVAPQFDYLDP